MDANQRDSRAVCEEPLTPPPLLSVDSHPRKEGPTGPTVPTTRTCVICSSSSHLKRNCPQVRCDACGLQGHFQRDCPQSAVIDANANANEDGEELRMSVCFACGSSRHVQSQCPSRFQAVECYQCHQLGHVMSVCPYTRCYNCGVYGHSAQVCHSKPHCFHCSNAGHRSSECPIKYKGRICYQCKEPGHEAANCPQGQLCRMCRQPGHLVARCPVVECNNCHEKGHTSGVCDKVHCDNCGGTHHTTICRNPGWQYSYNSYQDGFEEEAAPPSPPSEAPVAAPVAPTPSDGEERGGGGVPAPPEPVGTLAPLTPPPPPPPPPPQTEGWLESVPPYVPSGALRSGRVAVVVDGPYFERCVRSRGDNPHQTPVYYTRTAEALRHTLQFIGDIFQKEPIAFWFDTDPSAFTEFLETAMPLAYRETAFRETAMRKKYLTDEMNGDRALPNVVSRLVGGMKRQYGYTRDGPGYVWVQTGVDVALSTAVIEYFHDSQQYQQVVLLCGDSDVYPAVHYCNSLRQQKKGAKEAIANSVRVCGTSTSLSKLYGLHQDLSDFLPRILLNRPTHSERGRELGFPTSLVFS